MRILIAIHGAHSQPEHRQAQRETWLRYIYLLRDIFGEAFKDIDYRYFLGQPEGSEADTIYLPFPDGPITNGPYRTLWPLRKTEALVRYALNGGYDFVFKCDDDTFVRVHELLPSGFEEHDYSGFTEPHYAFNGVGHYRWAQGGAGYWLSRRAMEIIDANGLHLVPAEDFAVGQLLASHGIAPFHDERYRPQVSQHDLEAPDPNWITLHKVSPDWMRRLGQV